MHGPTKISPKSWLAFDLNVLRRMTFTSVALPFTDNPALGSYLKRWDVRVASNDPMQSSWMRASAQIANPGERLSSDDVNVVLEDAYVPGYRLNNPALTHWFSETDAWWFDNVRQRIDRLTSPLSRSIASTIAMASGDYVFSFTDETRERSYCLRARKNNAIWFLLLGSRQWACRGQSRMEEKPIKEIEPKEKRQWAESNAHHS